jgi:hypothetical protein
MKRSRADAGQRHPSGAGQADAAEFDHCQVETHPADAEDQNDGDDGQVARFHRIGS